MFYPISFFFVINVKNDDEYGNEDDNDIIKSDFLGHNYDWGNCMGYNTLFIHFVSKFVYST